MISRCSTSPTTSTSSFAPSLELRANLTAYDAVYVALSEVLDAPLLTFDRRLAAAPGHYADIELLPSG